MTNKGYFLLPQPCSCSYTGARNVLPHTSEDFHFSSSRAPELTAAKRHFLLSSPLFFCTLLSCLQTIFSPIPQEWWLADNRGMTALSGWPGCDVRVSQGTRGSRGEYFGSGSALTSQSPQVGLIPDRKCNSSQELRQNKSVEFNISSFLHTAGNQAHHMRRQSGICQDSSAALFSCPPARCTRFYLVAFLSLSLSLCHRTLISFGSYVILSCK